MKLTSPRLHHADLIHLYPDDWDESGKVCVARPFTYEQSGFIFRLKLALLVFRGELDAVKFKVEEKEEDYVTTMRFARWKKEKGK